MTDSTFGDDVIAYAKEHPVFDAQTVLTVLDARIAEVSLGTALVQLLNQAYALGYLNAKRETKMIYTPEF